MVRPLPPDMDSCEPKCRCTNGPNNGAAFNCAAPCPGGGEFRSADCDCASAGPGCWLVEALTTMPDGEVIDDTHPRGQFHNVPTAGDYFEWNDGRSQEPHVIGLQSNPGMSATELGYTMEPNGGDCDAVGAEENTCDLSPIFEQEFTGTSERCQDEDAVIGGDASPWSYSNSYRSVIIYPSSAVGSIDAEKHSVLGLTDSIHPGCTTSNVAMSIPEEFPSWATCTNPWRIWVMYSIVPSYIDGHDGTVTSCDESLCPPGLNWAGSDAFMEWGNDWEITNWYSGLTGGVITCGLMARGGIVGKFSITKFWQDNIFDGVWRGDKFRSGNVIVPETPLRTGRSYGTCNQCANIISDRVKVYLGPAEVEGWDRVGEDPPANAVVPFELIGEWFNPDIDHDKLHCRSY